MFNFNSAAVVIHNVSDWANTFVQSPVAVIQNQLNQPQNECESTQDQSDNEGAQSNITSSEPPKEMPSLTPNAHEHMLRTILSPKHPNAAAMWSKLCHKVDVAYPPEEQLELIDTDTCNGEAMMSDMQYSLRLALLAFPPSTVAILSETLSLSFKSHTKMLMEYLKISAKDILIDHSGSGNSRLLSNARDQVHEPAHYLVVDHQKQRIVVSIRGTSSIEDLTNDSNHCFNGQSRSFSIARTTGYVYGGILESAQFVLRSVTGTLVRACKQNPKYQVVIAGHSIGAGVAAFLGMMYKDNSVIRGRNGKRLKVWCFGSPCIVSREFTDSKLFNGYITTVNLDTDVVTRLSTESVKIWNLRQELISEYSTDKIEGILHGDGDDGAKFLRILKRLRSPKPDQELFPVGRVLWFVPDIVMDDDKPDKALRRKILMKITEGDRDEDDGVNTDSKMDGDDSVESEEAACGAIDADAMSNESATSPNVLELPKFVQAKSCPLFRVRSRPLYDSSDDEDDADNDQALPSLQMSSSAVANTRRERNRYRMMMQNQNRLSAVLMHDYPEIVKENAAVQVPGVTSGTTKKHAPLQINGYVLCDASRCRNIFQELVVDYPTSMDLHLPRPYLWACGTTLKMKD